MKPRKALSALLLALALLLASCAIDEEADEQQGVVTEQPTNNSNGNKVVLTDVFMFPDGKERFCVVDASGNITGGCDIDRTVRGKKLDEFRR